MSFVQMPPTEHGNGAAPPVEDWDPNMYSDSEPPDEERQKIIPLVTLGSLMEPALARAERRRTHDEEPIPVPFPGWAEALGGGLWPGSHFVISGTGVGKSQLTIQTAVGAAKAGIPTAYIGLELDEASIALRALGEQLGVRWSTLYLGRCSEQTLERAREAAPGFEALPFYVDFGPPRGWPPSRLYALAESMRLAHPTGPMLIVLDYLQLVGDEPGTTRRPELRQRVSDAAYATRDVARRFDVAVVVVSSAARNHYGLLSSDATEAGLRTAKFSGFDEPVRTIAHPHVLIGLGKESGDLEFSADTVTVLIRWPALLDNGERAIVVAVPKVRAGFERWSALAFDGGRFTELDVKDISELPEPPKKRRAGQPEPVEDSELRGRVLETVRRNPNLKSATAVAVATKGTKTTLLRVVKELLADGSVVWIDGFARAGSSIPNQNEEPNR